MVWFDICEELNKLFFIYVHAYYFVFVVRFLCAVCLIFNFCQSYIINGITERISVSSLISYYLFCSCSNYIMAME